MRNRFLLRRRLLWQSGAKPFVVSGKDITVDFSSPEATRVAKFWGDLIASGNLSPIDTYTDDWNAAMAGSSVSAAPASLWNMVSRSTGIGCSEAAITFSKMFSPYCRNKRRKNEGA